MMIPQKAFLLGLLFLISIEGRANDRYLHEIKSQPEFDSFARVYESGTPYPLPHILFVIDRKDQNRIYYINTKKYKFHKDFINGNYLSLEKGRAFFENNYLKLNRRFILGTLAYQTPVRMWTFEFWDGDLLTADMIRLSYERIKNSFFQKVAFKPNSLRHEEHARSLKGIDVLLQSEISRQQDYQPYNIARGIGRVHVIEKLDEHVEIGFNEILVLKEVPVSLPPVAGIITSVPSTALSHINLLARTWAIPNGYIKNAHEVFKQYDGWWVNFETLASSYKIEQAKLDQLKEYQARLKERRDLMTPRFDLTVKRLERLAHQRKNSSISFGAKSANLGEVINARAGLLVPEGFTIPFFYYDQFIKQNGFEDLIYGMMNEDRFVHDPAYRREQLEGLRQKLQKGRFDQKLRSQILSRVGLQLKPRGYFVRSSTNSEDLPNFNGAGLYTTVPNLRDPAELIEAIKTVWASVWRFEAYEARERAGIDHSKVFMGVIIQETINAESAGVMITTDPFDVENRNGIYISAKHGLGIKVVEGRKVAEQVIFNARANSTKVLSRSEEDSLLTVNQSGGTREIAVQSGKAVLTDSLIRGLAAAATKIRQIFGVDQDIEWAIKGGQIYILQSRPYITGGEI
jgi:rifampicin phosphotransferase